MTTDRTHHLRGLLLTTVGVLILTPDSLLIRLIGTDVWTLLFWRGLLQGVALVGFYLVYYRRAAWGEFRAMGWVGVAVAGLYTGSNILFIQSIRLTLVANTLIILSSVPLLGAIFSRIFLHEQVRFRTWAATTLGLLGVGVIFVSSAGGASLAGDTCALGAAGLLAAAFVVIRGARGVSMVPAVALSGFMIALAVAPLASPLAVGPMDARWLLLLGGFIAPVSFALITVGPRYVPAPEVSLVMLLETLLGPVWVALVLGEAPPGGTLLGGALVLGTLVVHSVLALREGAKPPPPP